MSPFLRAKINLAEIQQVGLTDRGQLLERLGQAHAVVERCYCRLKDFRRIATRDDKLARNFFSSVCLITALVYWI
jgi:hypothetical protein